MPCAAFAKRFAMFAVAFAVPSLAAWVSMRRSDAKSSILTVVPPELLAEAVACTGGGIAVTVPCRTNFAVL